MVITLIGYRGTGKSSVAPALAKRLGWQAVDADVEIEARAGSTIAEIFAHEGEPGFRAREREVLKDLLSRSQLVLAAGGGAVLDAGTRATMQAAGPVVWLQASVETILRRMQQDETTTTRRPALTHEADPRREIVRVLETRSPLYRQTASIVVPTEDRSLLQVVDVILDQLPHAVTRGAG